MNGANRHRVVDHIVGYLAATGVDYVFGVDGANIEDLYDAAYFRDDITAVLAKHEFSAATMADGYSRSGAGLGCGRRDVGRRLPEHRCRPGRGTGQPGAGAGADRPAADVPRRPRRLPGHQRPQRRARRRGVVLGGLGVLPTDRDPDRHRQRAAGGASRPPQRGGPAVLLLPKTSSSRIVDFGAGSVTGNRNRLAPVPVDPQVIAHALRSADGPSRSSPASRSPATTRAPSWSSCVRCCGRGWRPSPTRKTSRARRDWIVVGARSDRCDGPSRCRVRVADSALCLLVGTRMTVTARAGLDDALAIGADVLDRLGGAVSCRAPTSTPTICAVLSL